MENYNIAKQMFLEGKSLRQIGRELGINRKKLSLLLKQDDLYTDKKISKGQLDNAVKMIGAGKKITHIASELNVDRHTLSKELKKLEVRNPQKYKRKITKYDKEILSMYKEKKLSIADIAIELSISTNAVWNCLIEHSEVDNDRTSAIYTYNTELFKSISTEWEAYWLGFLYADGYVNTYGTSIELCLQKRDEDHVKKFMRYVSIDKNNSYDKDVKGYMQHRIDIHSKELAQNLIKCGCQNNKTFKLQFPTNDIVPNELMHHFIRGFFDGDGCIYMSHNRKIVSIVCASCDFISHIQDVFVNEVGMTKTKLSKNRNLYTFSNGNQLDILALKKYLYKDATIYLQRKYEKF